MPDNEKSQPGAPQEPTRGLGKLVGPTERHRKAVAGILAGKSQKQALLDAGYSLSTATHASAAVLRRSKGELCRAIEAEGLTVDALARKIIEGVNSDDLRARALFTKQVIDVSGDAAPVKVDADVHSHQTIEQIRREQSRLDEALKDWLK